MSLPPPLPILSPPRLSRRQLLWRAALGGVAAFLPLRLLYATQEPKVAFPAVSLPNPNAYDGCIKAVGLLKKSSGDLTNSYRAEYATPTDKNRHEILSSQQKTVVLENNAAALQTFRNALSLPYHEPPKRDGEGLYPHLSPFRVLVRLSIADGDIKREKGDFSHAVSAYLDGVEFGQKIPRGGPLITRLVGIAAQQMGRRPIWKHLDRLDADAGKVGAKRMESIIAAHVPIAETWAEEKYFGQAARLKTLRSTNEMAQSLFGDDESNSDPPPATLWQKVGVYATLFRWSKTRIMDNFSAYMDARTKNSLLPYLRRPPVPLPSDPINRRSIGRALPYFDPTELKDANSSQTQNALLCAALALRAFHAETGRYPLALAGLVTSGYLQAVPLDPFSPNGDDILRYRRESPNEMVLWSVGPDGKNDNGTPILNKTQTGNARYFVSQGSLGDIVAGTNVF